jgi:hypothetical protein
MKLQTFKVGDYEIAATYSKGSGDLLFCIHGLGSSHDSFRYLEGQSAFNGYSILALIYLGLVTWPIGRVFIHNA